MNDHLLRVADNDRLLLKGHLKTMVAWMLTVGATWPLFHDNSLVALGCGIVALFVGTDGALNLMDGEHEQQRLADEAAGCPVRVMAPSFPPQG